MMYLNSKRFGIYSVKLEASPETQFREFVPDDDVLIIEN